MRHAFCLLVIGTLACSAEGASDRYTSAVIRGGAEPGIRFSSGLTVCDEVLRAGHWVNRYWLSTGMIVPEFHLAQQNRQPPIDSFELGIEGQDLAGTWRWASAGQKPVRQPEGLEVTFTLTSAARPIKVAVHTLLTGGPAMVRWLEITNTGEKPTALTRVSPWSGLLWDTAQYRERLARGEAAFEVAHAEYQEWGHEGAWRFEPVAGSTQTVSGTRGRSGWGHPTFFAHNKATGEWFAGSLGWSGNWSMSWTGAEDPEDRARLSFRLGPAAADPVLRVLAPGETVRTPDTHLLLMNADLDRVIQAMHEHVRRDVLPPPIPGREYQVESNHRGYIVDHEDEAGLKREIDLAAGVGAEEFLIDAGWFGPEPNRWWDNAGDWYAGAWLPNDITPVREYARKKGLLFGLWVEIESVGAAATLRKRHPDWILTRNGQPVANGRQLDFANPEVAAWAESEIARLIRKYDLDMFRLDYNTVVEEGGNRLKDGFLENTEWRHVEALYAMFDRLRAQFPRVIFQNCAGGGGRLDLGIMRRFHNTELSDWMRGPRNLKILNGVTWILPPEILLRTFGTEVEEHATDGDLDQQLRTIMLCRPIFRGLSPSLEEFNPIAREKIKASVEEFKAVVRPIMIGSRVYHHTPVLPMMEASPWLVLEYAGSDSRRAVAGLFRTSLQGDSTFRFFPRGLDFAHSYNVRFGNSGQTVEIPGYRLLQEGIPVRIEHAMGSELLTFESR
ncbi:MAG: alpha-galactosidase [Bryobacteraceae bacterium]